MLQLDDLSSDEWRKIHASLDRGIGDAALSRACGVAKMRL